MNIRGVEIPTYLYGTAWKEGETSQLVAMALEAGFRGIDTANQRKHYYEAAVGQGIQSGYKDFGIRREDLFIQTKYTFSQGQDHRKPYDEGNPIGLQVVQSFDSSLDHLMTNYLDSYILHGPYTASGISEFDWQAWRAMEAIAKKGKAKCLGISNIRLSQLKVLCDDAEIKPAFVQNRCFAQMAWDREVRAYCLENEIVYQGFSLLTANVPYIKQAQIIEIANRYGKTLPQVIFKFSMQMGMLPLTGTTNRDHMRQDLDVFDFELTDVELKLIETIAINP